MSFRKSFGYSVCPALALVLVLFFPHALRAQQALQTTQNPMAQYQPTESTSQRSLILQEAQRRLDARKRQQTHQIELATYGHQYEFFAGGGYLRFRPGSYLQHNQEAAWNVGLTDYVYGDLGITAEVRAYYGGAYTGAHPNGINQAYSPNISQYVYLAGPTYRFYHGERWGWTAQVLGGAGQGKFSIDTNGVPPSLVGLYNDQWVPYLNVGTSVDYNLGTNLALRLTPNYLMSRYGSQFQHNKGWQIDLVYRFHPRRDYSFR